MLPATIIKCRKFHAVSVQIQAVFILDQGWAPRGPLRVTLGEEECPQGPENREPQGSWGGGGWCDGGGFECVQEGRYRENMAYVRRPRPWCTGRSPHILVMVFPLRSEAAGEARNLREWWAWRHKYRGTSAVGARTSGTENTLSTLSFPLCDVPLRAMAHPCLQALQLFNFGTHQNLKATLRHKIKA